MHEMTPDWATKWSSAAKLKLMAVFWRERSAESILETPRGAISGKDETSPFLLCQVLLDRDDL